MREGGAINKIGCWLSCFAAEESCDSSLTRMEGPQVWFRGNGSEWGQRLWGHALGKLGLEQGKKVGELELWRTCWDGQTGGSVPVPLLCLASICLPISPPGRPGAPEDLFHFPFNRSAFSLISNTHRTPLVLRGQG